MDPAITSPPPNGDSNRGSEILAIDGLIFGISWSMVLLRLLTRTWITRNLWWDDATIFLAALTNSVGLGLYVAMVLYGLGRHRYYLSDYSAKELRKYDYLDWIQAFITLAISKISICLLLLRLSNFSKLKTVINTLIGFILITHVPLIFLYMFHCTPISKEWNPVIDGRCFSKNMIVNIMIAQGVFSIVIDFVGAGFPVLLLWNVKIKTHSKIAIWLLMGFGIITGVACIVRTSFTSNHIHADDFSWEGVGIAMAKMLEVNLGIIAACLPIMKPLYAYCHGLCNGAPLELGRRRSSQPTYTNSSQPNLRGRWYRLRSSRTTLPTGHTSQAAPPPPPPPPLPPHNRDSFHQMKSQIPLHAPTLRLPPRVVGVKKVEDTRDREIDLPIQGIEKKVEFGVAAEPSTANNTSGASTRVGFDEMP